MEKASIEKEQTFKNPGSFLDHPSTITDPLIPI